MKRHIAGKDYVCEWCEIDGALFPAIKKGEQYAIISTTVWDTWEGKEVTPKRIRFKVCPNCWAKPKFTHIRAWADMRGFHYSKVPPQ